jgi:uncharacterized repeat protein (TIGR03837 family)
LIAPQLTCDIFCRVVDNYGDIGVCWRLARQLAAEHDVAVRLVVDDLTAFSHLAPKVDPLLVEQAVSAVNVIAWTDELDLRVPASLVIEAFACELPARYLKRMAACQISPHWLNLEYLSAESWVAEHHLLPSPHPALPLTKHFFFPGFVPDTGGLLRERGLLEDLSDFRHADDGQSPQRIFLFAYDQAPVESLMGAIAAMGTAVTVTAPGRSLEGKLKHWCASWDENVLKPAPVLEFDTPGFVAQTEFDRVLRTHDVLFVRGEDSFVRAQWAARPFVWHIYPQAEGAHWIKLNAFLDLYCQELDTAAAKALREMWRVWNAADHERLAVAWAGFLDHQAALRVHAVKWARNLSQMPDLASNLLSFYKKKAKI